MNTHKFARKTFYVDAICVSEANIEEVAAWCSGEVQLDETGHQFIRVAVERPLTERQSQAFVGDWVLFASKGFKVFTPKAFEKSFEKVRILTKEQADAAGITVPHEPRPKNEKKPVRDEAIVPRKKHNKRAVPTAPKAPKLGNVGAAFGEAKAKAEEKLAKVAAKTPIFADERGDLVDVVETKPRTRADVEADALIAEIDALREK